MASLPGGDADGSGGGGRTAAAGATASASAGVLPPFSASPSLAGFMHQPQQQVPLPLQLPSLGLQQPMLQLHGLAGGGGGAAAAVPSNYFTLPMLQQQAVPGAGAGSGVQMQMQGFPLGAPLGSLSLGWPLGGCDGGGALPPASSGVLPPSVPQPGALHQHVPQDLQQALSAPQIMSNTDHNGSTEGTQAWGGGARGRGSGGALEADESAAAESRLKSGGGGGARRGGEHRKSKFRGVQWDRSGSKWRARIHTDKTRHIGYYEREEDAGRAWDLAALKYFGETSEVLTKLNFQSSLAIFRQQASAAAGQASSEAGGGAAAAAGAAQGQGSAGPSSCTGGGGGQPQQFRGVAKMVDGRFKATVTIKRVPYPIGIFDTAEDAARAYDRENLRLNGRGAITNFPLFDYLPEDARGQGSPIPPPYPYGDQFGGLPTSSMLPSADAGGLASSQAAQRTGRQGAAPPSGAPSALLHTPAMLPQPSPKRRKFGEESSLGLAAAGGGGAAQHAQHAQHALAAGQVPPVFHSPPDPVGSHMEESAGFSGVMRLGSGTRDEWQAYLTVDLGKFGSAEEAARAHDRAKLLVSGFQAGTNFPLADAYAAGTAAAAAAAAPQAAAGQPQPAPAYRGVVLRAGAWLALLDIGGSAYELGPYPSELAAAQAYDRYSLLLNGIRAQTNFPPWHYLASPAECQSLLEAVAQVQQAAAGSGTPQGNKMPTPPSAERAEGHPEQQQPQPQPQQPQQQQQQQHPHQAGLGPGMAHIAAGVQPQQHGLQAPPPQVQQVQQQLEQQVQQARQQLEQAQQAQQALQQQFIMPGVPGPLAQQQQQQQQQHTAGQLGTSASLDLGSQLARLSSLHAMAGGQPGSGAAAAAAATAPLSGWPAAGGQRLP